MAQDLKREKLQKLLEDTSGLPTTSVHFQPPTNIRMTYPCIVYERDDRRTTYADNGPYRTHKRYSIKVIDRDPNSAIPEMIASLPMCSFDRFYTADNLNHDVYNIYF